MTKIKNIITNIMMSIIRNILNMRIKISMVLLFMKRMRATSHTRLPFLLCEVEGLLAFSILSFLLKTKSILNVGMSTNGEGIPSKLNFLYFIFASFKLNV
jgi:hypothetical protein